MGKIWVYGDNINTDVIFPGKYIQQLLSAEEMGLHALENLDAEFNRSAQPGDFIIGGRNWGCGSSREQAARCLKVRGIKAIVAKSFARIFYRNAINEGLPVIACPPAIDWITENNPSTIAIDFSSNVIVVDSAAFPFEPFPDYILQILQCGGLIEFVKQLGQM